MSGILQGFFPPTPNVIEPIDVNAQQIKTKIIRAHEEGLTGIELTGMPVLLENRKLLEKNGFIFIENRWRAHEHGSKNGLIKLPNLIVWG